MPDITSRHQCIMSKRVGETYEHIYSNTLTCIGNRNGELGEIEKEYSKCDTLSQSTKNKWICLSMMPHIWGY